MQENNTYYQNLHKGAKPHIFENARILRARQTGAEGKMWKLLRNRKLKGRKFRRQHAFAHYILDFYCHECKLAIELDGYHHNSSEVKLYDEVRTEYIRNHGITVIRFWNSEVLEDAEKVLEKISSYL